MKKYYTLLLLCCLLPAVLFAGGKKDTGAVPSTDTESHATPAAPVRQTEYTVKAVIPNGAPAVCAAKMLTDRPAVTQNSQTLYEVLQAPEALQARLISGEADVAIVPANLAAVLYAKGVPIRFAGAVVWGILYGLTSEPINSLEDLKGKDILTFGRGLTPDITIREILESYRLTPDKDVTFTYVQSASEAASAFISGKASIAIIPEPMVSIVLSKKPETQVFLDVQKAWKEKLGGDSSYPQAVVVMTKKLIEEHPDYAARFLRELEQSTAWAKENPAQAGEYTARVHQGIPAQIIAKGVSRMNIGFVPADSARPALEKYFSILKKANPKFIGGALPQDDFYYTPEK